MKRLFILAAATVALASCAKTQVVYNEEPQEIAFRQVENVMTKGGAGTSLGNWKDGSMGVFAYKTGETNSYFTNAKFAKSDTEWVGVDDLGNAKHYYWPFQGSLDFYVYAPHDADFTCDRTTHKIKKSAFTNSDYGVGNSYSGTADGSTLFYNYNCPDLMYGSTIITSEKTDQALNVSLKHALALVQVNATATTGSVVKIQLMKLTGTPRSANLAVAYEDKDSNNSTALEGTAGWDNYSGTIDLTIISTEKSVTNSLEQLGNEVLVIPGNAQTSFSIEYKLANSETVFTATLPLNTAGSPTWEPGKKYVYNITFGVEEIKFAPEVVEWETGGVTAGSNGGVSVATYPQP